MQASFTYIADHSVLVTFAQSVSEESHAQVLALDKALMSSPPHGMIEIVPALVNLLISFDPLLTTHRDIQVAAERVLDGLQTATLEGIEHRVEVCYDLDLAPDLPAVAQATDQSQEAVVAAHLAGDYKVLMYGFSPGYAYLDGVPASTQVPRKPAALRDVPAGSVIIAGPQCLISTLTMPTGWSIIGRTAKSILTGDDTSPFLFSIGDRVRFTRIDRESYEQAMRSRADV